MIQRPNSPHFSPEFINQINHAHFDYGADLERHRQMERRIVLRYWAQQERRQRRVRIAKALGKGIVIFLCGWVAAYLVCSL